MKPLNRLVRLATAWPYLTVAVSVLAAVLSLVYAARNLGFITSGREMLPQGEPYVQRDAEYGDEFPDLDQLVVAVEADSFALQKAYARRLERELGRDPATFRHVSYRVDARQLGGRALLYLPAADLVQLRDGVLAHEGALAALAARPTLDQLIDAVRTEMVSAFVGRAVDLDLDLDDGAASDLDLGAVRGLLDTVGARIAAPRPRQPDDEPLLPLGGEFEERSWFRSEDGRLLFVMVEVQGSEDGGFTEKQQAIESLRATIERLRADFPGVAVGVTGAPALSNDEMVAAFRDSGIATVLSFILTLAVLVTGCRRTSTPLLMLAVLAVSQCWAIGVATLVIGHLSIFSVMFISIVIGIGIDYGIYFLFRDDEERGLGHDVRASVERAATRSGPGMLLGALTAAGAFFVLLATDFPGVQELGIISGAAILLSWLSMVTLLPAVVLLADRRRRRPVRPAPARALGLPLIEWATRHPRAVVGVATFATGLSCLALPHVYFDYNLLNLQAAGTESVRWERRVLETASRSSFAALSSAGSLAELRERVAAFEVLGSVSSVDSVLAVIPDDQAAKQAILGELSPLLAHVRIGGAEPVDPARLVAALIALRERLDLAVAEAPAGSERDEIAGVRDRAAGLAHAIAGMPAAEAAHRLARLQTDLRRDLRRALHWLRAGAAAPAIDLQTLPESLRRRYVGRSGRLLIEIQPAIDIWERAGAERFARELRTVDAAVTGTPIISFESIRYMERAYREGTLYAFLVVGLLGLLIIGRMRETGLALLPLVLGAVWTIGLMALCGQPFNLANVFGFPLVIGTGAEFGFNIVLRRLEDGRAAGPLVPRSTALAVLLNGLTTIAGFAAMMLADHRGIFGLGLTLTLGMVATLTASLVVLPVVMRWTETPASEPELAGAPDLEPTV